MDNFDVEVRQSLNEVYKKYKNLKRGEPNDKRIIEVCAPVVPGDC